MTAAREYAEIADTMYEAIAPFVNFDDDPQMAHRIGFAAGVALARALTVVAPLTTLTPADLIDAVQNGGN